MKELLPDLNSAVWDELKFALRTGRTTPLIVDVRSEKEALEEPIPLSVNIPILRDTERHQVGLKYKQEGSAKALELGHQLVSGETKAQRVKAWQGAIDAGARWVCCWRGGLRSQITQGWLSDAGTKISRVQGGAKALRRCALQVFESLNPNHFAYVLHGRTGVGKTDLLREFESPSLCFVDLEAIANHRGSSFGLRLGAVQPRQVLFESELALRIAGAHANQQHLLLEGESRLIGKCALPLHFYELMDSAPAVFLTASQEVRLENLYREYVLEPLKHNSAEMVLEVYLKHLKRIQKRLGGLKYAEIQEQLEKAFKDPLGESHRDWIDNLLTSYYDRLYDYSRERLKGRIVFEGSRNEVIEFLEGSAHEEKANVRIKN